MSRTIEMVESTWDIAPNAFDAAYEALCADERFAKAKLSMNECKDLNEAMNLAGFATYEDENGHLRLSNCIVNKRPCLRWAIEDTIHHLAPIDDLPDPKRGFVLVWEDCDTSDQYRWECSEDGMLMARELEPCWGEAVNIDDRHPFG